MNSIHLLPYDGSATQYLPSFPLKQNEKCPILPPGLDKKIIRCAKLDVNIYSRFRNFNAQEFILNSSNTAVMSNKLYGGFLICIKHSSTSRKLEVFIPNLYIPK